MECIVMDHGPCIIHNLIMHILTFYHLKLLESPSLRQECFDRQSHLHSLTFGYEVPVID